MTLINLKTAFNLNKQDFESPKSKIKIVSKCKVSIKTTRIGQRSECCISGFFLCVLFKFLFLILEYLKDGISMK